MNNISFEDRLSEVIKLIQNNSLLDAERDLLELIQVKPTDSDLFNLVGVIYSVRNLHAEAINWFERGIKISITNDALFLNLGTSLMSLGKNNDAIEAFNNAIKINPNSVHSYFNLGNLYLDLEQYEECIKYYDQALKIKNDFVDCLINKAVALANQDNAVQAIFEYKKALDFESNNSKIHLNLASLYEINKKYEEALAHYDRAIQIKPDYPEAWNNKGVILGDLRRYEEALAHYDRAIQIKPDYPEAWNNKGVILGDLRRYEEALAHYDRAIQIKPDYPEAWNNKGVILGDLRRYEEAVEHYKRAINLDENLDWSLGNLIHSKLMIADWRDLDEEIDILKKKLLEGKNVTTPFPLLSLIDNENLHQVTAKNYVAQKFPVQKKLGKIEREISKEKKIVIAYFSSDFSNHPVIYLLNELFELHNREKFTVYAFNTGSPISGYEAVRLKKSFDHFVEAGQLTDIEITEKSRKFSVDIAINLGGHTDNSRVNVFAYRTAPIQVNFLGYPGTMGAEYIDYIIADEQVVPHESFQYYSEKVVWMPNSFLPYDSKRMPSKIKYTRSEYGLPEDKFVYCCFNNAYKFNPRILSVWIKIMEKNRHSVLWLSSNNPAFQKNMANHFERGEIKKERIIFASKIENHEEYLSAYSLADLFLDTNPYNAHATALDALRGGLPVLTMAGDSFASRVGKSILYSKNINELIAKNDKDYIDKAILYSESKKEYENVRKKINENNKNLRKDSVTYCKNLENIYIKLIDNLNNSN